MLANNSAMNKIIFQTSIFIFVLLHIFTYIYIYIYIYRERERERERGDGNMRKVGMKFVKKVLSPDQKGESELNIFVVVRHYHVKENSKKKKFRLLSHTKVMGVQQI